MRITRKQLRKLILEAITASEKGVIDFPEEDKEPVASETERNWWWPGRTARRTSNTPTAAEQWPLPPDMGLEELISSDDIEMRKTGLALGEDMMDYPEGSIQAAEDLHRKVRSEEEYSKLRASDFWVEVRVKDLTPPRGQRVVRHIKVYIPYDMTGRVIRAYEDVKHLEVAFPDINDEMSVDPARVHDIITNGKPFEGISKEEALDRLARLFIASDELYEYYNDRLIEILGVPDEKLSLPLIVNSNPHALMNAEHTVDSVPVVHSLYGRLHVRINNRAREMRGDK